MDNSPTTVKDNLEVTGVSRSGRVRKKSSKLVDFRSPDDIDAARAQKRANLQKTPSARSYANQAMHTTTPRSRNSQQVYQSQSHQLSSSILSNNMNNVTHTTSAGSGAIKMEPLSLIDTEAQLEMLLSPGRYSNNGDVKKEIDSDDEYELTIDTTIRKSAYMSEKSSKKKIYKDGEIVLSRPQRKDKGKARFTAYMLWSKEARDEMLKVNPDLDFAQTSRRLSQMWANVPSNEKHIWRRRAKRVTMKNKRALKKGEKLTTNYLNRPGKKKPGRKPKIPKNNVTNTTTTPHKTKHERHSSALNGKRDDADTGASKEVIHSNSNKSSSITPGAYKIIGTTPTDVAAHLKLLGDNLTIIGQRLKEHEGQITVSGSLSVLLDSLLCSLGPLMCLTTNIPGISQPNGHLKDTLVSILDDVAYVMPGL